MKSLYYPLILLFICSSLNAQKYYKSEKFKISFTSYEDLGYYADELYPNEVTYGNKNYEIFISMSVLDEFLENIENTTLLLANELDFKNIENKGEIPNLEKSHYISANTIVDGIEFSIYLISIYKPYRDILYNIIISGSNLEKTEGERLVKSFRVF